jgi:hypothetical protein
MFKYAKVDRHRLLTVLPLGVQIQYLGGLRQQFLSRISEFPKQLFIDLYKSIVAETGSNACDV